jgi:hypothetical protein
MRKNPLWARKVLAYEGALKKTVKALGIGKGD